MRFRTKRGNTGGIGYRNGCEDFVEECEKERDGQKNERRE